MEGLSKTSNKNVYDTLPDDNQIFTGRSAWIIILQIQSRIAEKTINNVFLFDTGSAEEDQNSWNGQANIADQNKSKKYIWRWSWIRDKSVSYKREGGGLSVGVLKKVC